LILLAFGGLLTLSGAFTEGVAQEKNRYAPFPEVANLSDGISWPAGQALPIFATPAATLDAIEVQSLTPGFSHRGEHRLGEFPSRR
jgi:hypothetical protein